LNLAQDNWTREREDLVEAERLVKKEYEAARQAMQDWEVIAMEERSVRESLSDHVVGLEEQLTALKVSYDRVATDHEKQSSVIDGLQRALQELQNGACNLNQQPRRYLLTMVHAARRKELREIVENTQSQIDALTINCQELEKHARGAESSLADARQDLERILPFEKEVKEKNLLIGKLRHEAVTLNDHLRKALRMLKRDNADDKIDKQLVTNVFLQFVSIQRGDTKKYEVLQLIASVLDWNDGELCFYTYTICTTTLLIRLRTTREGGTFTTGHSSEYELGPLHV
jgi:chromosome segregation ATPase